MTSNIQKRLILDMDPSLHAKVKHMALQKGSSIKDLVTGLIIKEIIKVDYKKNIDSSV